VQLAGLLGAAVGGQLGKVGGPERVLVCLEVLPFLAAVS